MTNTLFLIAIQAYMIYWALLTWIDGRLHTQPSRVSQTEAMSTSIPKYNLTDNVKFLCEKDMLYLDIRKLLTPHEVRV